MPGGGAILSQVQGTTNRIGCHPRERGTELNKSQSQIVVVSLLLGGIFLIKEAEGKRKGIPGLWKL